MSLSQVPVAGEQGMLQNIDVLLEQSGVEPFEACEIFSNMPVDFTKELYLQLVAAGVPVEEIAIQLGLTSGDSGEGMPLLQQICMGGTVVIAACFAIYSLTVGRHNGDKEYQAFENAAKEVQKTYDEIKAGWRVFLNLFGKGSKQ